jgi:hypothetical protein
MIFLRVDDLSSPLRFRLCCKKVKAVEDASVRGESASELSANDQHAARGCDCGRARRPVWSPADCQSDP